MTDTAILNAVEKRDDLASQINVLQEKVEDLKRELARVDAFIASWSEFAGKPAPALTSSEKFPNPDRAFVGDMAAKCLEVNGRPMDRSTLFAAVKNEGVGIRGKDPEMVFSTMMWRMQDRFVRIPKYGYWFRDRPFSNVYKPGDIPDSRKKDNIVQELINIAKE